MDIKTTTSLRKISSLERKIRIIQGGAGSSKTFSILMILINHASTVPDQVILVASKELSKMRLTVIRDFVTIMNFFGLLDRNRYVGGTLYTFENGSTIKFIGLDVQDIGKGLRSHVLFVNECNKIGFETYRELSLRAENVYLDFNANTRFWCHDELMDRDDADFLQLSYLDNEYIPQGEVDELMRYKEKGFDTAGNIISTYWANKYNVYALGEIGGVIGRIFNWTEIPYNEYLKIDRRVIIGCDWGTVDPFAVAELKYQDGSLYIHELNYRSETQLHNTMNGADKASIVGDSDGGVVRWLFNRLNIPKGYDIICDNSRPSKILALRKAGWENALAARKGPGSILDGIDLLQNLNVYYTSTSKNIKSEQYTYCWDTDREGNPLEKPVDYSNHTIDLARYVGIFLREAGIIRSV